jgi:glucose/mannose-6-phosphate isomerase
METMSSLIAAFPQNLTDALAIAREVKLSIPADGIRNVVICGMGGSGIGGRIVAQWISSTCPVPILSLQDYEVPAFVGKDTLVIGSSYSGNTEETLIAAEECRRRGARFIGICSGGKMEDFCRNNDYDVIIVPGGNPPRTAIAFSIVQLTAIFSQLGFAEGIALQQIESARGLIVSGQEAIKAEAHEIAERMCGKVPVVYASADYEGVAVRAKQQFNENSKMIGWMHVVPEMNHNELVGWGGGDDRYAALFLQTGDLNKRNSRRFDISVEIVRKKTGNVIIAEAKGDNKIERSLYLINLVDWTSLYLSELKNGDPIEIEVIDYLKDELSKIED